MISALPQLAHQSPVGLKRPIGQSLIRALRHIVEFDSGLLIRLSPELFTGFVFIHTIQGFLILHPDSPTFFIRLQYSQRYLRGEQPFPVEAEIEPFFQDLVFTPLW